MKLLKKIFVLLLVLVAPFVIAGCAKEDDGTHEKIDNTKIVNVGILQLATHSALDSAREGFIQGLKEAGYIDGENIKVTVQNPEGDKSSMELMARNLVRSNDIVLGIATDAANALKNASENEGIKLPILFTAVTDPVDAKLVASVTDVQGRVTGTSDMNPVSEQIELIKQIVPSINTIGILYTIDETNSKVQSDMAEAKATELGLSVKVNTVTGVSDITQNLRQLITSGAQAIYIPTDNNLAKNMPAVKSVAEELKIPVICGESGMVEAGGLITLGINYQKLGILTGTMAAEIINGKQAKDIAVRTLGLEDCDLTVNKAAQDAIEIVIPEEILNKATIVGIE